MSMTSFPMFSGLQERSEWQKLHSMELIVRRRKWEYDKKTILGMSFASLPYRSLWFKTTLRTNGS